MRPVRRIDVPTVVTGIVLTGFGALAALLASGTVLPGPLSTWFAVVLLLAGVVGLFLSLARRPDAGHPDQP